MSDLQTADNLDQTRASLLEEARAMVKDARAEGATAPLDEASVRDRLTVADELLEESNRLRAEAAVSAERAKVDEAHSQMIGESNRTRTEIQADADAVNRDVQREAQLLGALSGQHFAEEVSIARAHNFSTAINREGLTGREASRMARSEGGRAELRALGVATDPAGGVLTPEQLEMQIYESLRTTQGLMAAGAELYVTNGVGDLVIPREATVTRGDSVGDITDEGAEITEDAQTFNELVLKAFKYASRIDISRELLADQGVNLVQYVGRRIGQKVGESMERDFTLGTGTDMPKGALHGVAAGNTVKSTFVASGTGKTETVKYQELVSAMGALDPKFLYGGSNAMDSMTSPMGMMAMGAKWMLNSSIYHSIIADLDNEGRPIHYTHRTTEKPFNTLLGIPVTFNNAMATYANTRDVIALGDFSKAYVVRLAGGFMLESSTEVRFTRQQVVYLGTCRADGDIRDDKAYRVIRTGT